MFDRNPLREVQLKISTAAMAAGVLAAGLLAARPAAAGVFDPETFTLANGMQVVVVPNHRMPVVTHMVWYKVGAADEPAGRSGIAHFLEHLMFKGTEILAPGEFSRTVARNGGRENAFTSYDFTGYYQSVAVDRLETVMRMEADRMTGLVLGPEQVEPERLVVLEERRQRIDNEPRAVLGEQASAALFVNHPYGRPIIGWEDEIRSLSVDELLAFYRRWYAPNNAILVVAGDITAEKLRPLAEKYYGAIPPAAAPPRRARPKVPPQTAAKEVTLRDARVRQPAWSRTWLAPGFHGGRRTDYYALEVLAEILGGGATSRLYRALVVEQGLAVAVGANYGGEALDLGRFVVSASPRPGVPVARLVAAVEAEIARLLGDGVPADELARVKTRMQADAVYSRDSLATGAQVLGAALTTGQTVADVEAWPERIGAVSAEDMLAAGRAVLRGGGAVTSLLLPENGEGS
jgi:zinc protease